MSIAIQSDTTHKQKNETSECHEAESENNTGTDKDEPLQPQLNFDIPKTLK